MLLWSYVQTQWRATGFGVVGLDYCAALKVAEVIGVDVDEDLIYRIRMLESWAMERINKDG